MKWLTPNFEEVQVSIAQQLVEGLGGPANIEELEPCIVRIRATVKDPAEVNEATIRNTNPLGVVSSGKYVQIIVGKNSDHLVEEMQEIIRELAVHAE